MSIEQAVIEKLRELPLDRQQEVLDFVEFLESKTKQQTFSSNSYHHQAGQVETVEMVAKQVSSSDRWIGMTALEAAQSVMGVVGSGPSDLSTNPGYMDGFGES